MHKTFRILVSRKSGIDKEENWRNKEGKTKSRSQEAMGNSPEWNGGSAFKIINSMFGKT